MRDEADKAKLELFMRELGSRVKSRGRIYLTGGATALLIGWRKMTVDIDLKANPEPRGLFEAIAELKDSLSVNVELASPDDFIPELPGWHDRSPFIGREGLVDFHHYDFYAQTLAKLERGHTRDLGDTAAMVREGLIDREKLWDLFLRIEPQLLRYPAIDALEFHRSVKEFCGQIR